MNKLMTFGVTLFAGLALSAAPQVSDVVLSQEGGTVKINYNLTGEPGIVTVDVQTNAGENAWVSIGGKHLTYFGGDANKIVQPGAKTITWKPRKAWPDNEVTRNVKAVISAWATNAPPDYMVVSLVSANSVAFYTSAENVPYGVTDDRYKTDYMVFRKIPAANVRWRMGSPRLPAEVGREVREVPHEVMLPDDYYIGVYEVTQRQYERLTGTRPSHFNLDSDYPTRPVECVKINSIRGKAADGYDWPNNGHTVSTTSFMGVLRAFAGQDGFDLPTEAQWEYACRAGCGAACYDGTELEPVNSGSTTAAHESDNLNAIARYQKNGGYVDGTAEPEASCTAANGTAKVGSYAPNAFGLYDMLGNLPEFCLDYYQDDLTGVDPTTGPASGSQRVVRGGGWSLIALAERSAYRTSMDMHWCMWYNGFRVAAPALVR